MDLKPLTHQQWEIDAQLIWPSNLVNNKPMQKLMKMCLIVDGLGLASLPYID